MGRILRPQVSFGEVGYRNRLKYVAPIETAKSLPFYGSVLAFPSTDAHQGESFIFDHFRSNTSYYFQSTSEKSSYNAVGRLLLGENPVEATQKEFDDYANLHVLKQFFKSNIADVESADDDVESAGDDVESAGDDVESAGDDVEYLFYKYWNQQILSVYSNLVLKLANSFSSDEGVVFFNQDLSYQEVYFYFVNDRLYVDVVVSDIVLTKRDYGAGDIVDVLNFGEARISMSLTDTGFKPIGFELENELLEQYLLGNIDFEDLITRGGFSSSVSNAAQDQAQAEQAQEGQAQPQAGKTQSTQFAVFSKVYNHANVESYEQSIQEKLVEAYSSLSETIKALVRGGEPSLILLLEEAQKLSESIMARKDLDVFVKLQAFQEINRVLLDPLVEINQESMFGQFDEFRDFINAKANIQFKLLLETINKLDRVRDPWLIPLFEKAQELSESISVREDLSGFVKLQAFQEINRVLLDPLVEINQESMFGQFYECRDFINAKADVQFKSLLETIKALVRGREPSLIPLFEEAQKLSESIMARKNLDVFVKLQAFQEINRILLDPLVEINDEAFYCIFRESENFRKAKTNYELESFYSTHKQLLENQSANMHSQYQAGNKIVPAVSAVAKDLLRQVEHAKVDGANIRGLNQVLETTTDLLRSPTDVGKIGAYKEFSKNINLGKGSWKKKLGGAMLCLVGVLAVASCVALALSGYGIIALPFAIKLAPLALGLISGGSAIAGVGVTIGGGVLAHKGRDSGTRKAASSLFKACAKAEKANAKLAARDASSPEAVDESLSALSPSS